MDLKPDNQVTIIETDLNVDFEAPIDHEDGIGGAVAKSRREAAAAPMDVGQSGAAAAAAMEEEEEKEEESGFAAFSGAGNSLSGRTAPKVGTADISVTTPVPPPEEGRQDMSKFQNPFNLRAEERAAQMKKGFGTETDSSDDELGPGDSTAFAAFSGNGNSLR